MSDPRAAQTTNSVADPTRCENPVARGEGKGAASETDDALVDADPTDWIECWNCAGEGSLDDCLEDCCVCLDPPCCTQRCDICRGNGGWMGVPGDDAQ